MTTMSTNIQKDVEQTVKAKRFIGPQEDHETWRSRKSHSEADMMKVYKELFFAGFPATELYEFNRSNTMEKKAANLEADHAKEQKNNHASRRCTSNTTQPLPEQFVYDFFAHYGSIEKLTYNAKRGIGSVTFTTGAAGEQCYLTSHLSVIKHPNKDKVGVHNNNRNNSSDNDDDDDDDNNNNIKEKQFFDLVLYLEIAQCCPFVNPSMMLIHELQSGEMSRSLLNTFPLIDRKYNSHVANDVVMYWEEDKTTSTVTEKHDCNSQDAVERNNNNNNNDKEEEEKKKSKIEETPVAKGAAKVNSVVAKRVGPSFPGGNVEPAILANTLWTLIQPSCIASMTHAEKLNGYQVTVLDCWWEYYNQYVLHKTQPSSERIHNRYFAFAQRPSLVQEIIELQKVECGLVISKACGNNINNSNNNNSTTNSSVMSEEAASKILARLRTDMTFHCALVYLFHKQRLRYDPSWASLMRDLYKSRLVNAVVLQYYKTQTNAVKEKMAMEATLSASVANTEADNDWLRMSLLTAAANVIKNTRFLCHVEENQTQAQNIFNKTMRHSSANKQQQQEQQSVSQRHSSKNNIYSINNNDSNIVEDDDSNTDEHESEILYLVVIQNIDGYANSGSASSLLSICEDYFSFVALSGHIGYNALHNTQSMCKELLRVLMVPLMLIGFIIALIVYFNIRTPLVTAIHSFSSSSSSSLSSWSNHTNTNSSVLNATHRVIPSQPNVHINLVADM